MKLLSLTNLESKMKDQTQHKMILNAEIQAFLVQLIVLLGHFDGTKENGIEMI